MLAQLVKQLDVLDSICVGPYIAGPSITAGDSALLPTFVFLTFILPRYFGWQDVFAGRPKLAAWWAHMQQDPAAKRVSAAAAAAAAASDQTVLRQCSDLDGCKGRWNCHCCCRIVQSLPSCPAALSLTPEVQLIQLCGTDLFDVALPM